MGRLRPIVRRELMSPSSVLAADDPTRVPFWRRPVSTFGRLRMTDLDNGRSLAFSLPSSAGPPPEWCSQMLSPELHTSDCSSACPGSSTWVDKVPSQDTPSLDLADRQGGVDPDDPQVAHTPSLNLACCRGDVNPDSPQVARNQSRDGGALTPASTRIERSPEQPSVKAVSSVSVSLANLFETTPD